jgi:hypothetical protein
MADDKSDRRAPDRSRINLSEEYEVRYWTKALGVDEQQLRALVELHGNSADKVREAVKKSA